MQENELKRYSGRLVRLQQKDGQTFWTGQIQGISSDAITIKDKFGRLVTIENNEIKTVSEWS